MNYNMGKKIFIWVLGSLIVITGLYFAVLHSKSNHDFALSEIDLVSSTMGILEEELTFSYLLDYADIIAVGKISGTDVLNETRPVKTVVIEDPIVGKIEDKEILVYIDEELVEQDETYLFFLSSFDDPLYDKHFYVQHHEFIVQVGEDNQLSRLTNAFEKTYEQPFIENEYNDLTVLTKEVKSLNVAEKQKESIPQFSTQQELESAADVIAHIEVTNIADDRGIATTYYELIESHKGNLDVSPLLLPTNKIEEGKQYMLYLTRSDNDVFPVTRDSSIVEVKDTD